MSEIKRGEMVKHLIGGPDLFVEAINDGIATCTWLESDKVIKQGEFQIASLKPKLKMNINPDHIS